MFSQQCTIMLSQQCTMNQFSQLNSINLKPLQQMFSDDLLHDKIHLTNDNSTATKLSLDPFWDLVLVESVIIKNGSSIRFRILDINSSVYVGLGIRNVIQANSYQLKQWDQIGHGCFVVSCHGWVFSHSNSELNNSKQGFWFDKGDVIRLETKFNELWFINETKNTQFKMRIQMTSEQWDQACFCAQLQGRGDSVSILNNPDNDHLPQNNSCIIM